MDYYFNDDFSMLYEKEGESIRAIPTKQLSEEDKRLVYLTKYEYNE